jgi:hypothetical protein
VSTLWAAVLPPVEQEHLAQARQIQGLSFTAHIPLVCFGITFPSMVLLGPTAASRLREPRCKRRRPGNSRGRWRPAIARRTMPVTRETAPRRA